MADRELQFRLTANVASFMTGIATAENGMKRLKKFIGPAMIIGTFAAMAKSALDLERGLFDLRRGYNLSNEEMLKYKDSLQATSMVSGVSQDDLFAISKGALAESHDIGKVTASLGDMATAFMATGGNAEDFGKFVGIAMRELKVGPEGVKDLMSSLQLMGNMPGMEKNLAQILGSGEGLMEAARKYYGENVNPAQVQQMAAMAMVGGSPEAVIKMTTRLLTGQVRKKAAALHINLFNKDGTKKDLLSVLKEITKIAGGNRGKVEAMISEIFGKGSTDLIKITDDLAKVDKALETTTAKDNWSKLRDQALTASGSMTAATNKLGGMFTYLSDKAMAPAIDAFVKEMSKIDPSSIEALGKAMELLGKGIGFTVGGLLQIPAAVQEAAYWLDWWNNKRLEDEKKNPIVAPEKSTPLTYLENPLAGLQEKMRQNKLKKLEQKGELFGSSVTTMPSSMLSATGQMSPMAPATILLNNNTTINVPGQPPVVEKKTKQFVVE